MSTPPIAADSAELFRLLVASVKDYVIIVLDPDGYVLTWNEGAERIKGYTSDEIIGKHFSTFYTEEAISAKHPQKELKLAVANGRYEEEGWRVRKGGQQFWANVVMTPLYESDRLVGFAKVTRDLTEKKRTEEALLKSRGELEIVNTELSRARDQAQAASRFKSEFVANMSHEIRTPMNGIIGMCNVLLRTDLNASQLQYAESIKTAANALLTVINDILDFSKIEAGKIELEIGEFNPVRLVEGACEILSTQARSKQLSLMSFVDPRLPEALRGDGERLRQVLINLTSNAIKFSTEGEIVVSAHLESRQDNTLYVRFSVVDKGIGLTAEEQQKLFQPFVQADGSVSRKFGGTGLGLSISKQLVELMGGNIGVKSDKGAGSTFWLVVPLEHATDAPTITTKDELRDVRVLVVDDEPQSREIIHNYVLSWGMRNGRACSANEGLKILRQAYVDGDPYRLAIIDLMMPDKNGIEMAKEIFADPALSNVRLVLLTAFDTPGLGTQAIEMGFKAYLTKPIRQSQMLDCLMQVVCGGRPIITKSAIDSKTNYGISPKHYRTERVLVAEDHAINQQVAQLYLDEIGLACDIVTNGSEAVKTLEAQAYDLILMDCQMPEMDGLTATREIRKIEQLTGKRVPIIAMTAHAMEGDREKCLASGMDDYLSKPIDPEQLKRVIDKWLPADGHQSVVTIDLPADYTGIDIAALTERYGNEHVQRFIQLFVSTAPNEVLELRAALQDRDLAKLKRHTHSLKGISASVFAQTIKNLCSQIESAMSKNAIAETDSLIDQLEYELTLITETSKKIHGS